MNMHSKKVIFSAILAASILGTLALLSFQGPSGQAQAIVETPQRKTLGLSFTDPDDYVNQTGKSAAMAEVTSEKISLKRGDSRNIEVIAKHMGGENADQSINVKLLPPIGYTLYPPSVVESTTSEERAQAASSGTPIPGSIDLASFMTIQEPSSKAISKANQQAYNVVISIPKDLPDELIGEEIFIPINIEVTDSSGRAVPGLGTGINVVVS